MAAQVEEIRKPAFLQDGDLAVVPITDEKLLAVPAHHSFT